MVERHDAKTTTVRESTQQFIYTYTWSLTDTTIFRLCGDSNVNDLPCICLYFVTCDNSTLNEFYCTGNSHFIHQIQGEIVDIPEAPEPPNPTAKCPIYRWNLQHKYNYTVSSLADKYWLQKVYHCCLTLSFVFPSMASRMCCCWVSSLGQMEGCCRGESQVSVQKNIVK